MPKIKLFADYQPHSKQIAFHNSKARFKALTAGVRSGKTYGAARDFIYKICRDYKNIPPEKSTFLVYWVIAPTYSLTQVAMREVATVLAGYGVIEPVISPPLVSGWNKTEKRLCLFNGRVLIWFKSADKPNALVSEGLNGLWIDEAARLKADAWRGNLRQRLSDRAGWAIFSTTPLGTNWYYNDIYLRGDPKSSYYDPMFENFRFRTIDNTSVPGLVKEVEQAKKELARVYFEREYEASFEAFTGQIYEELYYETHFVNIDKRPVYTRYLGGLDFGWGQAAFVVLGQTEAGAWHLIYEDIAGHRAVTSPGGADDNTWATRISSAIRFYPDITIYCDSADPEAISQLRRSGLPVRPAVKDVINGIGIVASLIHTNRLIISHACPISWGQMRAYRWDVYQGVSLDRPAPNQDDHAPDAIRYALYSDYRRRQNTPIITSRQVVGF